jgi:hypothetical protein
MRHYQKGEYDEALTFVCNLLFLTLASNSLNAEQLIPFKTGGTSGHETEKKLAQEETYDAQRSYTRFHFEDEEMDFAFQWVLG